ncbi:MAG: hypothetical protein RRZ64_00190 [Rikenellaceae bacterium]
MHEVFKKFNGKKVSVTLINTLSLPIHKTGRLEIDGDWAYLYDDGKDGKEYNVAINMNKNNVTEIIAI